MEITNNLQDDIINAPSWFKEAIGKLPSNHILENTLGDVSYSKWNSEDNNENLIILIHGTGAHKKWWDPIAPQLTKESNVIAVDLPGMGESGFREKYSIKDFGDAIVEIIEKEKAERGFKKIYLVGHSLGGQVAGYVASENQDLVTSLILIDTFIRPPDYDYESGTGGGGPLRMIKHYPDKLSILNRFRLMPQQKCANDWFMRYIAEHSVKETSEGWRWRFDDLMFKALERLFGYKFSFTCPALFVHGEQSLLTSGKILEHIINTYSDSMDFIGVPDAAHHVPLDKPLEIVAIIKKRLF